MLCLDPNQYLQKQACPHTSLELLLSVFLHVYKISITPFFQRRSLWSSVLEVPITVFPAFPINIMSSETQVNLEAEPLLEPPDHPHSIPQYTDSLSPELEGSILENNLYSQRKGFLPIFACISN